MMRRRYRGLQGCRGAAVLPRSFRAARSPDRAGRCARRVQLRARGAARSRSGARRNSRLLPDRPRHVSSTRCSGRRIDRILFAATKADHLHHSSHDRLEAVLRRAVARAVMRAEDTGADHRCRRACRRPRHAGGAGRARPRQACRRSSARRSRAKSPTARPSTATPKSRPFPANCRRIRKSCSRARRRFRGLASARADKADFRFLRFRPPHLAQDGADAAALPHIRLDRAMQFLIGDRLQ